jgi:hypothetical protein
MPSAPHHLTIEIMMTATARSDHSPQRRQRLPHDRDRRSRDAHDH